MNTICPLVLAEKFQRIRNLDAPDLAKAIQEQPRIPEALRFIQDASHQPGGLQKLSDELRAQFEDQFASEAMLAAGPPRNGRWTLKQCLPVWQAERREEIIPYRPRWGRRFNDWADMNIEASDTPRSLEAGKCHDPEEIESGLHEFNYEFFKNGCLSAARDELRDWLARWCNHEHGFNTPWWCPNLWTVLFDFMDRHAATAETALAPTEVKQIVFRELAFSISERVPTQFIGKSRFGKTESASVFCQMRPGLARLVKVPPENRTKDFLLAQAKAFHYTPRPRITTADLDRDIQFIACHSGLFLIYDESQWLVPSTYTQDTKAKRLDWIRSHVIDERGAAGCAFFATKQSHKEDLDKFVKKTGYAMEQWLGRMPPIVILPEAVDRDKMLAVAKVHFPDIPPVFLKLISARARQSEGLFQHMEFTAKRARHIAREARGQGATPTFEDIELAIAYMMPHAARPSAPDSPGSSPADALPMPGSAPEAPARSVQPASAAPSRNRLSALTSPALAGD